jgi:predicted nucleotidyltransferase
MYVARGMPVHSRWCERRSCSIIDGMHVDGAPRDAAVELARRVAAAFADLPEVDAVALGGSQANLVADEGSDIDLCVYARGGEVPIARRAVIAADARGAVELDNRFFETCDEWVDATTGIGVDVMYRDPRWIEDQLDRVLVRHEASIGYSTAFWHNVLRSTVLFDRRGWYTALNERARAPYPEPLRRAIVAKNHPLLRRNLSSYLHQVERAIARADAVSVNHRVAALLASYFDVLFAVNRVPHPGEKRLTALAEAACARTPPGFAATMQSLIAAIPGAEVVDHAAALVDGLDRLLIEEQLLAG